MFFFKIHDFNFKNLKLSILTKNSFKIRIIKFRISRVCWNFARLFHFRLKSNRNFPRQMEFSVLLKPNTFFPSAMLHQDTSLAQNVKKRPKQKPISV